MKTARVKRFEISVFIASIDEITGEQLELDAVKQLVKQCQNSYGAIYPVRIVENTYVSGIDYEEKGFSLTVSSLDWLEARIDHKSLLSFAAHLAEYMLNTCNQTRVCLSDEFNNTMTTFYNENIEVKL